MPETLAILRRPTGLSRVTRAAVVVQEQPGSGEPALEDAGRELGALDPGDERGLAALRQVFLRTSPAADGWSATATPAALPTRETPRPSAAHPRAFSGTKWRPPKTGRPARDARPHTRTWRSVCAALGIDEPHPRARPGLVAERLTPRVLEAEHGMAGSAAWVRRLDRAVRRLGSDRLPRFLLFADGRTAERLARWLEAIEVLGEPERAAALDVIAPRVPAAAEGLTESLARLRAARPEGAFRAALSRVVSGLESGASPRYAVSTIELEGEDPEGRERPWPIEDGGQPDTAAILREIRDRLGEVTDVPKGLARRLHSVLAHPDRERLVRRAVAEPEMSAEERLGWLRLATRYSESDEWMADETLFDAARERGAQVQARGAFLDQLARLLSWFDDRRSALELLEPAARLAPHSRSTADVVAQLLLDGRDAPLGRRALDALDATVSDRAAPRVGRGLLEFFLVDEAWAARLLASHPRAAIRVASRAGVVSRSRLRRALVAARARADWRPPTSLVQLAALDPASPVFARAPIPRVLKHALQVQRRGGSPTMAGHRARGHLERLARRWDVARLGLIERAIDRELRRGMPVSEEELSEAQRSALETLSRAGPHRRALRRVLRRVLDGQADPLDTHPATVAWFERHPGIDRALWHTGVRLECTVAGVGLVRLSVELDPLEALRLGDHAGTCLAIGGLLEEDPAGIVLDANKRVVYARSSAGRVLARQLVALSEEEQLVCHPVYRTDGAPDLDDLFVAYDHELAARLGVRIARGHYEVRSILSQHLWDDWIWDRLRPLE